MDSHQVNIDRITADLSKKYNGDPDHDVGVIQQYCSTLPPCEESAKLVAALGKYASQKFPTARAFILARHIDETIALLEKQFNGDADHDIRIVQEHCRQLPQSEDNFRLAIALSQYIAAKYPDSDAIKKSRAEYKKMTEKAEDLKKDVANIQQLIQDNEVEKAITGIRHILDENSLPKNDDSRLVSFSHPFEELLFRENFKETRPMMRISNLPEMLHLQLGSLYAQSGRYDEARAAVNQALELNPVNSAARIELANISIKEGNFDEAFSLLQQAFPFIYTRQMLAVYFTFIAIVVEKLDKNYPLAIGFAHLSIQYADNPIAHATLERIAKEHGVDDKKPDDDTFQKLARDADLPVAPAPEISALALKAAREIKSAHPAIAKQFFTIAYDLTHDESLLPEIQ